jgi:hypothetical protein
MSWPPQPDRDRQEIARPAAEASAWCRRLTMCYPGGLRDTLLPGYDSYGISRTMASHPPKPGGCGLAEVALSGPPVTIPTPLSPTWA